MPYADLHVHTTASDGAMPLSAVSRAAGRAGVRVVAITDHDRPHPGLSAPISEHEGVRLIRGIELRVDPERGNAVDLLGFGVHKTAELDALVDRIQRNRIDRGRRIVARVEDRLGLELGLEAKPGLGRPHIARAIADHPGSGYDYQGAFDELIGADGPCYVPREIPSFERGVGVLRDSCGLVGLAHPFRYPDPEAALALAADLDAVERFYPYGRPVDTEPLDRAIEKHELVATGGSDAHDDRLGRAGLSEAAYETVEARLS